MCLCVCVSESQKERERDVDVGIISDASFVGKCSMGKRFVVAFGVSFLFQVPSTTYGVAVAFGQPAPSI